MSYKQINNSPVFLVGDLHNNYKNFKQTYEERNLKDSYFIFLGDTSIAREEQFYQFTKLDKLFEKDNNKGLFIRGNHDNPHLHREDIWSKYYKSFEPIHTGYISINGIKGLVINGAITLNRSLLEDGVNYWKDFDKVDDCSNLTDKVSFIISHAAPLPDDSDKLLKTNCSKFILEDAALAKELSNEQTRLKSILHTNNPVLWCSGHYHTSAAYILNNTCNVYLIERNNIFNFSKNLCKILKKNQIM